MTRPEAWVAGQVYREAVVLLAGGVAEKRATGRWSHIGARADREKAADLAISTQGGGGPTTDAYLRWLGRKAEDLVAVRWTEIEAVAAALLVQKTLTGKQVREEIVGALREPIGATGSREGVAR
jgi:hypothetical protein